MNSGAKPRTGALFLGLLAAAFLAVVAVGCSDHGPTGLYSGALFGVNNGSANMVILTNYPSYEPSLTVTAGMGGDQYIMFMKNVGQGAAKGPIIATASLQANCSETLSSTATAVFGTPGEVINPGQVLQGYSCTGNGTIVTMAYSWQTSFPAACGVSQTALNFNVSAVDAKGEQWSGIGFVGTDY